MKMWDMGPLKCCEGLGDVMSINEPHPEGFKLSSAGEILSPRWEGRPAVRRQNSMVGPLTAATSREHA